MRTWEIAAPRELVFREQPDPQPGPEDVLVEIVCSAISPGTELHAYRTGPTEMMTSPGYLAAGTVIARGSEVDSVEVGARVRVSAPHASLALVPADGVTVLPDAVSFEEGCLTHLAGLGHYALHAGDYRAGDEVAVVGLGLVGMCSASVAELVGARVHGLDVVGSRLGRASDLGFATYDATDPAFAEAVSEASFGGIDVVIDTSGSWSGALTAVRVARKGTRISMLGVNRRPPDPEVGAELFAELLDFPARFHYESLRLTGCSFHPRSAVEPSAAWTAERCYRYLLDAMAAGRLDLGPLITDRVSPEEVGPMMEALDRGNLDHLAVIVNWRAS